MIDQAHKVRDRNPVEGLVNAAIILAELGRPDSASHIVGDALQSSVNLDELQRCVEAAKRLGDAALIDESIERSRHLVKDGSQQNPFATSARQARFAILAERHLDMATPYQELITRESFSDAQCLLYADIDLNTVDGSAVWMASIAKILSRNWKTVIVSKNPIKRDAVVRDLIESKNVIFITPGNTNFKDESLSLKQCVAIIRELDGSLCNLKAVIVRGLEAVGEVMADRQFYHRVYAYLTDLYEHSNDSISIKAGSREIVDRVARQGAGFLAQTPQIAKLIGKMTPFPPKIIDLPPPVPDTLFSHTHTPPDDAIIRIGYAGKIAPQWGIQQLCEWVARLRKSGSNVELTIIGDKVSGAGNAAQNKKFRQEIGSLLDSVEARRLGAMDRSEVMREMQNMDFAWCWRPPEFENHTLELSTKLVESVISGIPSVAFPSPVNRQSLGHDYPFFAERFEEFEGIIRIPNRQVPRQIRNRLNDIHSFKCQADALSISIDAQERDFNQSVAVATHDAKFLYPYYSNLKRRGASVGLENWEWGGPAIPKGKGGTAQFSDIVFCEWGLANAVWHSKNKKRGSRLVVRVHAQEVRQRAAKFGSSIIHEEVDCFVFVAEWVKNKAVELFRWPEVKTIVIPNFVLEHEYLSHPKSFDTPVKLGMVGIIPILKRFDRALDLVELLVHKGQKVELHIKGPIPHDVPYMQAAGRSDELKQYNTIFERINKCSILSKSVRFHPPGNDVALFYQNVDHILSPSDTESFHYALADGVLSGCHPVIWDRPDAGEIFDKSWIVKSTESAAKKILNFCRLSEEARQSELANNRNLLVSRYGSDSIFESLDRVLFSN